MLIRITPDLMVNSERIDYIEKKENVFYVIVNGKKMQLLIPVNDFMKEFDKSERHKQFFAG